MGRFLTRDTYTGEENEPLSLHLYTYCANDGVNCVDPSGHDISKNVPKIDVCVDGPIKYKNKAKKRGLFILCGW